MALSPAYGFQPTGYRKLRGLPFRPMGYGTGYVGAFENEFGQPDQLELFDQVDAFNEPAFVPSRERAPRRKRKCRTGPAVRCKLVKFKKSDKKRRMCWDANGRLTNKPKSKSKSGRKSKRRCRVVKGRRVCKSRRKR